MAKKHKNNKGWRATLFFFILIIFFVGVIFLVNHRVFRPTYDAMPKEVTSQLAFPLSKVTVSMSSDAMKTAFRNCDWVSVSGNMKLTQVQGREADYHAIVNENGMAERISSVYPRLFKWDAVSGQFTLPVESSKVLVPTWILFKLVESNAFPVSDPPEDTAAQ